MGGGRTGATIARPAPLGAAGGTQSGTLSLRNQPNEEMGGTPADCIAVHQALQPMCQATPGSPYFL